MLVNKTIRVDDEFWELFCFIAYNIDRTTPAEKLRDVIYSMIDCDLIGLEENFEEMLTEPYASALKRFKRKHNYDYVVPSKLRDDMQHVIDILINKKMAVDVNELLEHTGWDKKKLNHVLDLLVKSNAIHIEIYKRGVNKSSIFLTKEYCSKHSINPYEWEV